jgi:hypothetical protein
MIAATLCRCGLLDSVPEERLDVVDAIIFDAGASDKARAESLCFLMDHTEGFENVVSDLPVDADGGDGGASAGNTKSSKSKAAAAQDAANALARRQRTALQLETLTEFAEHHLGEQYALSAGLAKACLLIPNFGKSSFLPSVA